MSDHIYQKVEVAGSSSESLDDAIQGAIARAAKSHNHLNWFEVTEIRGHIEDQAVAHFQVTMKIGFRIDD